MTTPEQKKYYGIALGMGYQFALPDGVGVGQVFEFPSLESLQEWIKNAECHGPKCQRRAISLEFISC